MTTDSPVASKKAFLPTMKSWRNSVTVVLVLCLSPLGYGSQQELRQADSAHALSQIEHAKVRVEVERYAADEAAAIFGADLLRHGIQPLSLVIDNRSPQAYLFWKANVDDGCLPAAEVAKVAYENLVEVGAHGLLWTALLPANVLRMVKKSVHKTTKASLAGPPTNQDIQADFVRREIADTTVGPNSSLAGYLFIHLLKPGSHITVKLINAQTQEPLVFDMSL